MNVANSRKDGEPFEGDRDVVEQPDGRIRTDFREEQRRGSKVQLRLGRNEDLDQEVVCSNPGIADRILRQNASSARVIRPCAMSSAA